MPSSAATCSMTLWLSRHASCAAFRVVVLELSRADARHRMLEKGVERLAQQDPPRLPRSGLVAALVGDARDAMPVRGGHEGQRQHEREDAAKRDRRPAAQQIAAHQTKSVMTTRPRLPLRDCDATTAPIISTAQADAASSPDEGRRAQRQRGGQRQDRDHVQREVVRVLEHPADRALDAPVLDQVDAARVVEDRAEREVAGREHDQPHELLDALRRGQRVHHQHEDQDAPSRTRR